MDYKKLKNQIVQILSYIFPSTKTEGILFLLLLIFYIPLGVYLALNSSIIYNKDIPWDIYFSFDNRSIILSGGMIEKHPFSYYFIMPVYHLAIWIFHLTGDDLRYFSLTFTILCTVSVALGIVQVFKYLNNIIKIKKSLSFILIIFYAFFSTNLLLSFTPETYTLSIFLLSFYMYISALILSQGKKISVFLSTVMGVLVGGITITNLSKVFIPFLFENKKFNLKAIVSIGIKTLVSVGVFVFLYLWRRDWDYMKIFAKSTSQYEKFSNPKGETWWDMITSYFFGGNILFSSFVVKDLHFFKIQYKGLYYQVYDNPLQYIFYILVFILMVWALVANRKNKLLYILWLSFLVDVVIHCFMKFGLWVSFIYGGHWVFVVPLLLGWLFYAYRENKKIYTTLFIALGSMTVYLIINNLYRMTEFLDFVNTYYKL